MHKREKKALDLRRLIPLYLGAAVGPMGGVGILPLIPVLAGNWSIDFATASLAIPFYMIPFVLGQLFSGSIAQLFDARRALLFGFMVYALGGSLCGLSPVFWALLGGRVVQGVGAAFLAWGLVRAWRNKPHTHAHVHENGMTHTHQHEHQDDHVHRHAVGDKNRSITPWVLFAIFVFGPCESLVPLMLAAWAAGGFIGAALVAGAFSITTIATIMSVVGVLLLGVARIPLGKLDRYALAAAGLALVLCGLAILFGL